MRYHAKNLPHHVKHIYTHTLKIDFIRLSLRETKTENMLKQIPLFLVCQKTVCAKKLCKNIQQYFCISYRAIHLFVSMSNFKYFLRNNNDYITYKCQSYQYLTFNNNNNTN